MVVEDNITPLKSFFSMKPIHKEFIYVEDKSKLITGSHNDFREYKPPKYVHSFGKLHQKYYYLQLRWAVTRARLLRKPNSKLKHKQIIDSDEVFQWRPRSDQQINCLFMQSTHSVPQSDFLSVSLALRKARTHPIPNIARQKS